MTTTANSPEAILEALARFSDPLPTFSVSDDAIKAMRFAALATTVDETRAHLQTALRAMIKAIAPRVKQETIVLTIRPGIPKQGTLTKFKYVDYKSHGFTRTDKSFTAELEISSEYLDDPHALGLALAYGAVMHSGVALGDRTASNRGRFINERGSTFFGALGLKRSKQSVKSPKGRIDRLYGHVPTVTSAFLKSFGLDKALAVHGARPDGMTWGQLVDAFDVLASVPNTPSDAVTLECACPPKVDAEGNETPIKHGGHSEDVRNGYFITCCFACRSAWKATEDDKGKIKAERVDLSEAMQSLVKHSGAA